MHTIGPALFAIGENGQYLSRIGTLFPHHNLLVTAPQMHALQRDVFRDWLVREAESGGRPAPGAQKLDWESAESVDLIFADGGVVLIRPDLDRLKLAFLADDQLQEFFNVPRQRIKFLSIKDPRVRQALRKRGELWRMGITPSAPARMLEAVVRSRVRIALQPIYFYNPHTGTRFVTCSDFEDLAKGQDTALAAQLDEIAQHCIRRNRHKNPEVAFFRADSLMFGGPNFMGLNFSAMSGEELRLQHQRLAAQFRNATEPDFRRDHLVPGIGLQYLFSAISDDSRDTVSEDILQGLSAEFAPRIRWLPGGRFEEGEFVFTSLSPDSVSTVHDEDIDALQDPLARGFINNFIREYGNLEFLNLGRVEAISAASKLGRGRRGVYLAEIKVRGENNPRMLFLRVQRWGIRERLEETDDDGTPKDLVRAIFETEEYVDYTLDRRLACLQFGMRLPPRVNMRRVTEEYDGNRAEFDGRLFPVIYFERDYLPGIATNRITDRKLADTVYARKLAALLGRAAAPNLVVGRARLSVLPDAPAEPLFDDGDEIVIEGSDGIPHDLVLTDHSGAFTDWETPELIPFAKCYAGPVNRRADKVPEPREFAEIYLDVFRETFLRIQSDYRLRRSAFDGLFKHLHYSADGSFACRWEHVLRRMDQAVWSDIEAEVRRHITVLGQTSPAS